VRSFQQFDYHFTGEKGRKCSLDGVRNIQFYRRSERQQYLNDNELERNFLFAHHNFKFAYQDQSLHSILQPGEGLSAVSFIKRRYLDLNLKQSEKKDFESTAEIALLKVIQLLKNKKQDISGFEKNWQLLFKDNLTEDYFKKQDLNTNDLEFYRKRLEGFEKLAKNNRPEIKFSKYYAILAFDGDSMGQWLSKASSEQEHRDLSKLLIVFAKSAKEYLNAGHGRTIYAGGDDFLGLIHLESLLDVLIWMRDAFKSTVADKVPFKNENKVFTISAGVCIAHYKEPLRIVLNRAKAMEHKAKEWRGSKNAFGIAVIKGSGEDHETLWGFEDQTLEKIRCVIHAMQKGDVSNTFLKSFQREFAPVLPDAGTLTVDFRKLIKKELERLVYRSCVTGNAEQKRTNANQLSEILIEKLLPMNYNIKNFFALLNIIDFLHRTLNPLESEKM
jgi:CRISPR-associated protein Cmr2